MRATCGTLVGLFILANGTAAWAQVPGVRLVDQDAIFDYAFGSTLPTVTNGPSGNVPMNFQLGGAPLAPNTNWIFSGNWFYRFNGGPMERQLADPSGNATMTLTGTNQVEYQFPDVYTGPAVGPARGVIQPNVRAWMTYAVFDTGVDAARMSMNLCFENTGTTAHTLQLFAVLDIDVATTFLGDTYAPLSIVGTDRILTASDGLALAAMVGHGADGAAVGNFATIMGAMLDTVPNNFPDAPGTTGFPPTIDAVAVMQFNKLLPPGPVVCAGVDVDISILPEPTTLALLGLPLVALRRPNGRIVAA